MFTVRLKVRHYGAKGLLAIVGLVPVTTGMTVVHAANGTVASVGKPAYALTINATRPGVKISPDLYGAFFEEINHAGDGGIYAEEISNASFEDNDYVASNWTLEEGPHAKGSIAIASHDLLNPAQHNDLQLTIKSASAGASVGVANSGYWGIAVQKGEKFTGSFYAKPSADFHGGLNVSLVSVDGQRVFAQTSTATLTGGWNRYQFTLEPNASSDFALFEISSNHTGTVHLDVVSLFPPTWKARSNGLKVNLATMVQQMRPKFLRFPGGSFIEGDSLADAYQWKKTIGPLADRPGHWDIWGYRSSDGLGFSEYLQWAQDLGAEPIYVANVGIATNFSDAQAGQTVPLNQIQPYIQNVLDAIQYANGPVTSKWGALRARDGHPQPFHLKYIELGNENNFQYSAYIERYPLFYRAIKAKYPNITLIADCPVPGQPTDMIDDHYYESPQWFMDNANLFDSYSRTEPKVYVGEYAATTGVGQGNLYAALGEAAFMTGLERNSDVVRMASYAPLFVNVNDRTWNPDAIVFNNQQVYGTPSYYVQKMFAQNPGTFTLPTTLKSLVVGTAHSYSVTGGVGLGSWNTEVEYRNLQVTPNSGGQTLLSDAFTGKDTNQWTPMNGDWVTGHGVYKQTALITDASTTTGNASWNNYTVTLQAKKLGGDEGFLILFGVRNSHNYYWWNVGGWGNTQTAIEKTVDDAKSMVGTGVSQSVDTNQWYNIKIVVNGNHILCYLNGRLIQSVTDNTTPGPLYYDTSRDASTGDVIMKVVNVAATAETTQISINGLGAAVQTWGTVTTLASNSLTAENSFAAPHNVAPVTTAIGHLGKSFTYSFPKYSISIIRIPTSS